MFLANCILCELIMVMAVVAVLSGLGIASSKSKRRYGENPPDAKYTKGRR